MRVLISPVGNSQIYMKNKNLPTKVALVVIVNIRSSLGVEKTNSGTATAFHPDRYISSLCQGGTHGKYCLLKATLLQYLSKK